MIFEELTSLYDQVKTEVQRSNFDHALSIANVVKDRLDSLLGSAGTASGTPTDLTTDNQHDVTELYRLLNEVTDTMGIIALRQANYSQALTYFTTCISISESINDHPSVAQALINTGQIYAHRASYKLAQECFSKALDIYKSFDDYSSVAAAQMSLGLANLSLGNYPLALEYLEHAMAFYEHTHDTLSSANVMSNIGFVYYKRGTYSTAFEYYSKALAGFQQLDNTKGMATVSGNIGALYWSLGSYSNALDYFKQTLEMHERLGDKSGSARVTGNIGSVYFALESYETSLQYFQQALTIHEELGDESAIASVRGNMGAVYRNLGFYDKALEFYRKALAEHLSHGEQSLVAMVTGNIGIVYDALGSYDIALEFFEKALKRHQKLGELAAVATVMGNIGLVYGNPEFDGYNAEKAEEYFLASLSQSDAVGAKLNSYDQHKALAKLYERQHRWQDSHHHFKKFYELEKEIQSETTTQQAHNFAIEREIAILNHEQEVLRKQNSELQELNLKLEATSEKLRQVNEDKNQFMGMAAHDLKNPLMSIIVISKVLEESSSTLSPDELREYAIDINTSSKLMLDLIMNLLDVNKIENRTTFTDIEFFPVSECIHVTAERYISHAQKKSIELILDTDYSTVQTSKSTLNQVLDNLLSNAIKFSPAGKKVFLRTLSLEHTIRISIQDQGPGITEADMKKLYGQFTQLSAKPTGGEHSTGLGLSIVHKLVEMMNGNIWCESEAGNGATFIVELPKPQ